MANHSEEPQKNASPPENKPAIDAEKIHLYEQKRLLRRSFKDKPLEPKSLLDQAKAALAKAARGFEQGIGERDPISVEKEAEAGAKRRFAQHILRKTPRVTQIEPESFEKKVVIPPDAKDPEDTILP